jgi:uncharacterized protein YoxC
VVNSWPIVVIALSSAVVAVAVLVVLVGLLGTLRQFARLSGRLETLMDGVDRDARPALDSVRRTADDASRMMQSVRDEVVALSGTSKDVRTRVERTAASLEERFMEFDTLLDVLQDELEDTVLDVAALLRTTRRGTGLMRGLRRVLGRRR